MSAQQVTEAQAKLLLKAATLPYDKLPCQSVQGYASSSLDNVYNFLKQSNQFFFVEEDFVEGGQDAPDQSIVTLILNRTEIVFEWQATICYGELLFIDKSATLVALVNFA
jgi:hypothetical protein